MVVLAAGLTVLSPFVPATQSAGASATAGMSAGLAPVTIGLEPTRDPSVRSAADRMAPDTASRGELTGADRVVFTLMRNAGTIWAPMRQGFYPPNSSSWGWAKVQGKHGITSRIVAQAVFAKGSRKIESTRVVYRALATLQTRPSVSVVIRLVTDERSDAQSSRSDGKPVGVITMYCVLPNEVLLCPSWVNRGK